jgi:DNA-directed RNA polymerase subunit RPC12/RpoP
MKVNCSNCGKSFETKALTGSAAPVLCPKCDRAK